MLDYGCIESEKQMIEFSWRCFEKIGGEAVTVTVEVNDVVGD